MDPKELIGKSSDEIILGIARRQSEINAMKNELTRRKEYESKETTELGIQIERRKGGDEVVITPWQWMRHNVRVCWRGDDYPESPVIVYYNLDGAYMPKDTDLMVEVIRLSQKEADDMLGRHPGFPN